MVELFRISKGRKFQMMGAAWYVYYNETHFCGFKAVLHLY